VPLWKPALALGASSSKENHCAYSAFISDAKSLFFCLVAWRLPIPLPGRFSGVIGSASSDSYASNRRASQCDERCARAGPGFHRPAWDHLSVRASVRPVVARSGSWSTPGSGLRRSPRSRGARARTKEPLPSRRSPADRCGRVARAVRANCRRLAPGWPAGGSILAITNGPSGNLSIPTEEDFQAIASTLAAGYLRLRDRRRRETQLANSATSSRHGHEVNCCALKLRSEPSVH
jgi:hypothetical protein